MAGTASWGRSLLLWLAALAVVLGAAWWFVFGTLSPCGALRSEARRIGSAQLGLLGKLVAGQLTDLRTDDFTPAQCAVDAVKLKLEGPKALEALIIGGHDGLRALSRP